MDVRALIVSWPESSPRGAVRRFCAEHQISRSQFYEIWGRARAEGPVAAMAPRPRVQRATRHPQAISAGIEELAVVIRKELADQGLDHGPVTVRWHLQQAGVSAPAASTLARIFTARGMVVPQPQKRPRSADRRFEFATVHECWQLDAFEWPLGDGSLATVYQVLDDCSRYLVATGVGQSENATDAIAVFDQARTATGRVPCLFLTDNGAAFNQTRRGFNSQLVAHMATLGTRAITGRPGHPQTQGKDERIHQTTQRWLRAHPTQNPDELTATLAEFDHVYNHQRPHQSLAMSTPAQAHATRPHSVIPLPPEPPPAPTVPAVTARGHLSDHQGCLKVNRVTIYLGKEYSRTPVTVVATGHTLAIFEATSGNLLRTLTLVPGQRHYGNGKKSPGPPHRIKRPD